MVAQVFLEENIHATLWNFHKYCYCSNKDRSLSCNERKWPHCKGIHRNATEQLFTCWQRLADNVTQSRTTRYEECRLECYDMKFGRGLPTFRSASIFRVKEYTKLLYMKKSFSLVTCLVYSATRKMEGSIRFLRNFRELLSVYTASHCRR